MSFDFMKNLMIAEDDERFAKLCDTLEDVIRELDEDEERFTDVEVMQALDYVGFNLFRDSWEEFKKMELSKDLYIKDPEDGKNLIN